MATAEQFAPERCDPVLPFGHLRLGRPAVFHEVKGATRPKDPHTDLVTNTLATSAKPGQYAIAWGTGLGPDGNPDLNAPVPTDIPIDLEFYVGGQRATVSYKGRASCCSGSDVVVFQVPAGLDGCYVPWSRRSAPW